MLQLHYKTCPQRKGARSIQAQLNAVMFRREVKRDKHLGNQGAYQPWLGFLRAEEKGVSPRVHAFPIPTYLPNPPTPQKKSGEGGMKNHQQGLQSQPPREFPHPFPGGGATSLFFKQRRGEWVGLFPSICPFLPL